MHFDPTERLLSYSNTYIRECMHKHIQFSIICNSIKMGTPSISSTFPVYGNFYEKWSRTIHTYAFVYVYNKSVGKNPTVHPTAADPWGMENRGEGVNFHCLPSCQNVLLLLFSDKVYQGKAVTTAWALWCQEVHRCLPLTRACPLWQWAQADLSEREELTGPWASTWAESCCWRLLTPWEKNLILQEAMPWYTHVHSSTDHKPGHLGSNPSVHRWMNG